jgi:hypothetical protein
MTAFTVHAPGGDALAAARADRLIFVPDKIAWGAALVPWFWAPRHRLWLVFVAWIAVTIAVELLALRLDPGLGIVLTVAVATWFGLAGNDLRRWSLERRGHTLVGLVEGRSEDEAATRFLIRLADRTPPRSDPPAPFGETPSPAGGPAGTIGDPT